ncbi:S-adenosyl-L-methionine-dependent tRNA 4-demethylwyosine synthase TYW1 [Strongylocentrotus purpuratus]|uniref:S-adenosyl-L-methionine-dependent tRNA 4-demethylwyosine synthase TYW1 n=1 Tax=Strongylocentrotus purpuratus TaxID=7668 RepID=A0A7M7P845_STRPU|nr:S-adenosyl-L-methionine-dependent tRNA 4-demethylwyosine synthase TYW1 [Strongylocentrotus purpuratus]
MWNKLQWIGLTYVVILIQESNASNADDDRDMWAWQAGWQWVWLAVAVVIGIAIFSRQRKTSQQADKESRQNKSTSPVDPQASLDVTSIKIFYGTQTGTAKNLAAQLAKDIPDTVNTDVIDLKEFDPEKHVLLDQDEQTVCVYILSTYTDGEPPEGGAWFCRWLHESVNDFRVPGTLLKGHQFAVFGLGNSLYQDHYNTVSKKVHQWLIDLSARPLLPVGEGNGNVAASKHGGTEADFAAWKSDFLQAVLKCDGSGDKSCSCNQNGTCQSSVIGQMSLEQNTVTPERDGGGEEKADDGLDSDQEDPDEMDVIDVEDLGSVMNKMKNAKAMNGVKLGTEPKEMVTPTIRKNLTKQGYRIIGSHSGVKLCRWTKSMLRGRGGCYKHTFYGIESHRCMETTPSLACANKCVFCWRHHTNPVGTEWKWQMDDAESIVEGALKNHYNLIKQFKGVPGVKPERMKEAMKAQHCALSLVGEPIMYPKINRLVELLHKEQISTFLVTNAQFPDAIKNLLPVTQLYVSVDASTKESLKKVDRPLFRDFWPRFLESLKALSDKGQRTVYRLTLVKAWNDEEIQSYADLVQLGKPDFIEVKGVTYCGESKASTLTMQNIPWHEEVVHFVQKLMDLLPEYEIACEHEHSNCVLTANTKFKRDGEWWTWIDYSQFHALMAEYDASGGEKIFRAEDYMAKTPPWAVYGSKEQGFDPEETRFYRKGKKKDLGGC